VQNEPNVIDLVESSDKIVVITGAGISAPSGLPTFRGKEDSLWNDQELMKRSNITWLREHPEELESADLFWDFSKVEPNAAHYALVKAEEKHSVIIGTQNVDNLHQRAGSSTVYDLHGTVNRKKCLYCEDGQTFGLDSGTTSCPECGGPLRRATILFEENLDFNILRNVEQAVINCDLFIMVGTSGEVYPVAGFLDVACGFHKPSLLINDQEWVYPHPGFTKKIFGPCEEILPNLFGL
jgi:NAD-dependent deacetylase